MMADFSHRHRFTDWPNAEVPAIAVGVYVVWYGEILICCGRLGREFEKATAAGRLKLGLATRLASHAPGALERDQFCVYGRTDSLFVL
jgi:hypothetical protein